jgi:hypothetical protein
VQQDVWTPREGTVPLSDEMKGFDIEGPDGKMGKVDHVSYTGSCVIVTTGRILGKKYVVPASSVERVDLEEKTIVVDLNQDEIDSSPEYDDKLGFDDDCEKRVGAYYTDLRSSRTTATTR